MKLGLFGGSFDPIHAGHIQPIVAAARQLQLDEVLYLPTAHPPHKRDPREAPAWARYSMVELALLDEPSLKVSPFEMSDGASYTIDTVEHFLATRPDAQLHLLVGLDSYVELPTWRRWRDLIRNVRLVVLARPGEKRPKRDRVSAADNADVVFVTSAQVDVSSTQVRERLRRGQSVPAEWLPRPVLEYCRKYGLYGTSRR